jgi:large repetitive protein
MKKLNCFNFILILTFFLLSISNSYAQFTNCAVNAGVEQSWCFGQNIQLVGNIAGEIKPNTIKWTQVSGPSITIEKSNTLKAEVVKPPSGTYIFKLSSECTQGIAEQTVKHIVYEEVKVNAGPDITFDCFDFEKIPLTGFSTPPPGYTPIWTYDNQVMTIKDNMISMSPKLFLEACDARKSVSPISIELRFYNPTTGCSFKDSLRLLFNDYIIPLRILAAESCPESVELFKAVASCSQQGGKWSWVNPVDVEGATFTHPDSTFTKFTNLKPNKKYVLKWTTMTCKGERSVIDTMKTFLRKPVAPFERVERKRYFCDPPDSILIEPPRAPDPAQGEIGWWTFVDREEYDDLPQYAIDAYGKVKPSAPYTFDSLRVPLSGFSSGFTYEFRYTISNGSCETVYTEFIFVFGRHKGYTEYLSNNCGQGFDNQCVKNGRLCFFKPSISLFIQGGIEKFYLPKPPTIVKLPPKVTKAMVDLKNEGNGFSVTKDLPNGNYIFAFFPDTIDLQERCVEPVYFNISYSSPPPKANAGTDVFICTDKTELPGNVVTTPNWYLLDKVPNTANNPTMTNDSTSILKISGLTPNATYRFVYRSWGGVNCQSFYDTVTVRSANLQPPIPSIEADKTLCGGADFQISANLATLPSGTIGLWTLLSQVPAGKAPKIENPNSPTSNISGILPNTVYTFQFSLQNGCGINNAQLKVTTDANDGPQAPNAGKDQCLPSTVTKAVLIASQPAPSGASGEWSSVASNPNSVTFTNPLNFTTQVDGLQNGKTYQFVYTVKKGLCGLLRDTVKITIADKIKAAISDSLLVICNVKLPTSIELKASPLQGEWSQIDGIPGASIFDKNQATTTINNLTAGAYRFRWVAKNGVCDNGFDDVYVQIGGATPIVKLGNDTTLCANANGIFQLNAPNSQGFTGYWTFEDISNNQTSAGAFFIQNTNPTMPNAIVQLKPGKTRLRWSLYPNPPCQDQPSVDDIVIDYVPKSQIEKDTLELCAATLVELKGISSGAATGVWSQVSGINITNLPKNQQGDNPILIQLPQAGIYQLRYSISSTKCPSSQDELTIINHAAPPFPNIGLEDTLCVKEAILLNANVLPQGYTATWSVLSLPKNAQSPTFSPNANSQNVRVTNLQKGKYLFQYKISNGICTLSDVREDSIRLNTINAGNDFEICRDKEAQLGVFASNLKWSAFDKNPSPTNVEATIGKVSGMEKTGDYYFFLTDPQGCFDDLKITRIEGNTFNAIPKDVTLCEGKAITFSSDVKAIRTPFELQWQQSLDKGQTWQNIQGATQTSWQSTQKNGVQYYRILISDSRCGNDTSANFSLTYQSKFNPGLAPAPLSFCMKTDTSLNFNNLWKNAMLGGAWGTANLGIDAQGIFNPKSLSVGTYDIIYTLKDAQQVCPDSSSKTTLSIIALPKVDAGLDKNITCKEREVEISGIFDTSLNYSWQNPILQFMPQQLTHKVTGTGTYILNVIDPITKCRNLDTVKVKQLEPFIGDITANVSQPPCDEKGTISGLSIFGGTPPFQYFLNDKKIEYKQAINDLTAGKYKLTVEDKNGCRFERAFEITQLDPWTITLLQDATIDWGESVNLQGIVSIKNSQIDKIQWLQGSTIIDTSFILSKTVSPTKSATYEILIFDKKGCKRSAKVFIQVIFDPKVYAPNAFSPNDDGINDRFQLFPNRFIKAVHRLDIYDRWGEWIYNQGLMDFNDPLFGWDGKFRGQDMGAAVFVWVAEVEYFNGERHILKGDVMLMR